MALSKFDRWLLGAGGLIALLVLDVVLTIQNTRQLKQDADWVTHTHEVVDTLHEIHGHLREAEAVQRTFVITGGDTIAPAFATSIDAARKKVQKVKQLTTDNQTQQDRIPDLEKQIEDLARLWTRTMTVRKEQDFAAAREIVTAGETRRYMTDLQEHLREMDESERALLRDRTAKTENTYATAIVTGLVSGVAAIIGVVAFMMLMRRHLTARTAATAVISEQKERLRTTLASIGDAVLTTGVEGRVTFLNRVAEQLTGWTAHEAIGQPADTVFKIVNEQSEQAVESPIVKVLREGTIVGLANHTLLIARDGTRRPIDDSGSPIRAGDEIVGAVLVFRDVTEKRAAETALRSSEERLSLALDVAGLGLWDWDVGTAEMIWNTHQARIFGYPPGQSKRHYRDFAARILPEDLAQIEAGFRRAMRERSEYRWEHRVIWPDGTVRWVEAVGKFQFDATGQPARSVGVVIDVTDRKRIEERERRLLAEAAMANAKFRAFFEQGALFAGIMDLDGTLTDVNRLAWQWCGYTEEQVLGKPFWEDPWWSPSPALVAQVREASTRAAAGEMFHAEMPYFVADGSERVADVTILPIKDEAGRVLFLAPTGVDITDRKRGEQELRQAERLFKAAFNQQFQFMAILDPDGTVMDANDICFRSTGVERPQALGRLFWETPWWGTLPAMQRWWKDCVHDVVHNGTSVAGVVDYLQADGSIRHAEVVLTPLKDDAGRVMNLIIEGRDITERRHQEEALRTSEQRWRTMAEALPNLLWTDLPDGQSDWLSSQWRKYTGIAESELLGLRWLNTVHPDDRERTLTRWQAACADEADYDVEYRIRRHDGEYHWFKTRGVPLRNDQGRIIYWFGTCTDIEDVKRLEAALREVDRRKDEFLATLSHELRNPLAPIRNALQIINLSTDRHTREQARAVMERQLEQMVRLVDDLLDVSRITRGKLDLRKEQVQLSAVVNCAVETSRPAIEQMGHELTLTLPEQPILLDADLTRLAQVFSNLLTNSSKYTDRGGHISLTAVREENDVVVSVKDTGIGIAADQLPRLFQMFSQVEHALQRSQGGLGIGLTLVKRLVEMHGGRVEARSEGLGRGAEFVVRLPIVVQASSPQAPSEQNGPPAPKSSLRILIVDDNRDGANSLAMLLRIMGHDPRTAHDGQEGVDLAEEFRPDVTLLDIGLPKLNGYQVCRRIREQSWGKDMVLVAVTGWGQEEDRRRSQEAGFNQHLVKPVSPQDLMKLLSVLQRMKS
jgi:PAS domain S-box-containing protein